MCGGDLRKALWGNHRAHASGQGGGLRALTGHNGARRNDNVLPPPWALQAQSGCPSSLPTGPCLLTVQPGCAAPGTSRPGGRDSPRPASEAGPHGPPGLRSAVSVEAVPSPGLPLLREVLLWQPWAPDQAAPFFQLPSGRASPPPVGAGFRSGALLLDVEGHPPRPTACRPPRDPGAWYVWFTECHNVGHFRIEVQTAQVRWELQVWA